MLHLFRVSKTEHSEVMNILEYRDLQDVTQGRSDFARLCLPGIVTIKKFKHSYTSLNHVLRKQTTKAGK